MVKKWLLAGGLVLAATAERLWFDLGPNVELVMTAAVLAHLYLGRNWSIGVVLVSLAVSDLLIGNTMIIMFTWSAFGLIAWQAGKIKIYKGMKRVVAGGSYGLAGALFFYVYTNFGVWLISNMYVHSWEGLLKCYVMALPFFRIHLISSGSILAGVLAGVEGLKEIARTSLNCKLSKEYRQG